MSQNPYVMNQIAQGFNFNPGGAFVQGQQDRMGMIAAQYQQQLAQMQMAQAQAAAEQQKAMQAANQTLAGAIGLDPSLAVLGPQGMVQARNAIAPPFQPYEEARIVPGIGPDGKPLEVKEQVINARGDRRVIDYQSLGGGVTVNTGNQTPETVDWTALDSGILKTVETRHEGAQQALAGLQAAEAAKGLLSQGVFTGLAVPAKEFVARALDEIGAGNVDGLQDVLARSNAYDAETGVLVGQIIKLFGSGTGLSDADREMAQRIAGGLRGGMSAQGLNMILDRRIETGKRDIDTYNRYIKGLTNRAPNINEAYPLIDLGAPKDKPKDDQKPSRFRYNPETGQLEPQ